MKDWVVGHFNVQLLFDLLWALVRPVGSDCCVVGATVMERRLLSILNLRTMYREGWPVPHNTTR
jgi:hypothetical protein